MSDEVCLVRAFSEEDDSIEDFTDDLLNQGYAKSGRIEIKGLQYEDLVIILTNNGYDVQVTVNATNNATSNKYVIDYKPHDYIGECMNGA